MSVQIVLALAAWKLKKPVKIVWSRHESMIGHGKRHAAVIRARWGATKEGKVIAIENVLIGDGGAYMYTTNKVLGNSTITSTGPYNIPNVKTDVYGVYTNHVPGAAFRGFGAPQALFMAEMQMRPKHIKRGVGFAAGFKNIGFSFGYQENCWAKVEIHGKSEIERVVLHHAGAEVGQGTHTVMVQMAAEAVGVPFEKVRLIASDSATMENSGSASASRMTFMSGNAIRGAAEAALKKWQAEERPAIAEYKYLAPHTNQFHPETGYSTPNFAYAFAAQAVEVEVDTETGHVRVIRFVSADDVGQAINPILVEGQVEGAIVQAQGYALMEDWKTKDGRVLTDQLSTYLIPTIWDIPEKVETVIVEVPDPNGPWGARGLGELPFLPVAPAIGAAIHDATGAWVDEFPFTPERVLRALGNI
jgi:CO/xanthine dehydrogenase Mo-binding subunit